MVNNKIQIEINNKNFNKDIIYVALTLRGGFITKHFILDSDRKFNGNLAFFNIFCRYFNCNYSIPGLHFDVQRATTAISFVTNKNEVIVKLNRIFNSLFKFEYNEKIFNTAKVSAKDAFILQYKDEAFRAKNKAYEFSDLRKHFTLKSLINDIEQIDYTMFKACVEAFIVPGNVNVYILGETEKISFDEIILPDMALIKNHSVRLTGYDFDGYLRQEAFVINVARENYNLIIETFDFFNPKITNFTKLLIAEIYAEFIGQREFDVWVDSLDTSIIFPSEKLRKFKDDLTVPPDESTYIAARERLLKRYITILESNPEHFAIRAASLMTVGIYIDQYLSFIDKCSFKMFEEILGKADFKITEAQISLRKEVIKNG